MTDLYRIHARLSPMGQERRRADRQSVEISGAIEAAAEDGEALVCDLSELGFMAEAEGLFRPDTYVRVRLPIIGTRHARVIWAAAGRLGAEFVHPLERSELRRLIATAG